MSACATCGHEEKTHDERGCWFRDCDCRAYEPESVKEETT